MWRKISVFLSNNRRFIPLSATAILALVAYGLGAIFFEGMRNPQVFFNLFRNNSFLLICGVGMTFVILTGGIDLSVSGVVALTTVAAAALLREGWNAWYVIILMLLMGMTLGAVMGIFVAYMKVQPFIATLAGMWFARGMCFFISDDAIAVDNDIFRIIGQTKLLFPGLTELAEKQGSTAPYISFPIVAAFLVFFVGIYIAQYTRFGRTVYAIGGNEGRNEQSARLMGLPVERTKVLVYTFSGFCSALAGIMFCIFVSSGHGFYASGFELDVIASVVMGGTMLTGGTGYVFGTLFGVLVLAITQVLIQFIGSLSSWWTKIVIGLLTLTFIGVQSILAARKEGRSRVLDTEALAAVRRRRQRVLIGVAAVVVLGILAIIFIPKTGIGTMGATSDTVDCEVKPFREEEAARFTEEGAVIVYNRTAGPHCIDELFAVYADGRVVGNDGEKSVEGNVSVDEVNRALAVISDEYGWFSEKMYSTYHNPCRQCFAHYLTIVHDGQEKTVTAVDGGVDMQPEYGYTLSIIRPILPEITSAP